MKLLDTNNTRYAVLIRDQHKHQFITYYVYLIEDLEQDNVDHTDEHYMAECFRNDVLDSEVELTVKWDGCSNMDTGTVQAHFCSAEHVGDFHDVLQDCYSHAQTIFEF